MVYPLLYPPVDGNRQNSKGYHDHQKESGFEFIGNKRARIKKGKYPDQATGCRGAGLARYRRRFSTEDEIRFPFRHFSVFWKEGFGRSGLPDTSSDSFRRAFCRQAKSEARSIRFSGNSGRSLGCLPEDFGQARTKSPDLRAGFIPG